MATQRHHYLALAVFLVIVSFSFFILHREPVVYSELIKSPYRYVDWKTMLYIV